MRSIKKMNRYINKILFLGALKAKSIFQNHGISSKIKKLAVLWGILLGLTILPHCSGSVDQLQGHTDVKKETEQKDFKVLNILPFVFDSTHIIIHPLGIYYFKSDDYLLKSVRSSDDQFYTFLNKASQDTYTGQITNLYFENPANGNFQKLTDRTMIIQRIDFLRTIHKTFGLGFLLYEINDTPVQEKDKEDRFKTKSLYISALDGTSLKELTAQNHLFLEGVLLENENRYYFRSVEDKNGNREIDKNDQFHSYFISFSKEGYYVKEYKVEKAM